MIKQDCYTPEELDLFRAQLKEIVIEAQTEFRKRGYPTVHPRISEIKRKLKIK